MKHVHLLASKEQIINYTLAPIRANKHRLSELGYDVKIFYDQVPELLNCNVLCLVSKSTQKIMNDKGPIYQVDSPIIELLIKARASVDKIIWMDDSDSTTVTHFELLPYIDLYLKKQLLKDKVLYKNSCYGGRIFSDFYHREFGVTDESLFEQFYPLEKDDWDKVQVSWNIGLGDMRNAFSWKSIVHNLFPDRINANYKVPFTSPYNNKPVDLFLRTSVNLSRKTIAFQRQEFLNRLSKLLTSHGNISGMVGNELSRVNEEASKYLPEIGGRLSSSRYRVVMEHTKIAPSPFGWGEIGVRDYEAFMYGCVLLKPDVEHMETWPDLFVKDETYVAVDWDFSNLDETIEKLLEDKDRQLKIASNGQDAYRKSISITGMEEFCNHFVEKIEGGF